MVLSWLVFLSVFNLSKDFCVFFVSADFLLDMVLFLSDIRFAGDARNLSLDGIRYGVTVHSWLSFSAVGYIRCSVTACNYYDDEP